MIVQQNYKLTMHSFQVIRSDQNVTNYYGHAEQTECRDHNSEQDSIVRTVLWNYTQWHIMYQTYRSQY